MGSMEDAFRKAGVTPAPPEPLPEKACARCSKMFRPARPQHKLCPECIPLVRAERAAAEAPGKGSEGAEKPAAEKQAEEKPAEGGSAAAAEPRPRREPDRERPPRRERPSPGFATGGAPARTVPFPGTGGLPAGYLEGGYFTPTGALRPELLTRWAEHIAQGMASATADSTAPHLRAFYNHVKRAVAARKYGKQPIELVLNEIQKLKPFVLERAARRRVPDLFRQFLEANVDRVNDERTLLAFLQHFQAVMAYTGGLLHWRKERR